ncbi:MAG: hypothetical protein RR065_11260 [Clostridia bacterium]
MQKQKPYPRFPIYLFFFIFLLTGFLTTSDYGQPWDELDEMDILRANLWEYSAQLGLDQSAFKALAAQDTLAISPLAPISQSIERDHGISAFYPLAGIVMDASLPEHTRTLLWRLFCWALFTLGAWALYGCCLELSLPRWAGLLAALFLLLTPRFFAEGHYNNKDLVLMALTLCTLWQSLRLLRKPTFPRALWFAFFGALLCNTKVIGFAIWGLCALFVLLRQLAQHTLTKRVACVGATAFFALLGLYALLTPALWAAPKDFLSYVTTNAAAFGRWDSMLLFRGAVFQWSNSPLPWYYLPYMILATTPLWALLMIGVGQLCALSPIAHAGKRLFTNDRALSLALCTLLWLLPLGYAMLTRTKVYNGWRHFYFLYGPMLVLAAYGACAIVRALRSRRALLRAFCALLALAMLFTGIGICTQHPYQYAYYQPLLRLGGITGTYELDYWNVSLRNALNQLAAQVPNEPLPIRGSDYFTEVGLKRTLFAMPSEVAERFTVAGWDQPGVRYVLSNTNYAPYASFAPTASMRKTVSLSAYGEELCAVYEDTAAPANKEGLQ